MEGGRGEIVYNTVVQHSSGKLTYKLLAGSEREVAIGRGVWIWVVDL